MLPYMFVTVGVGLAAIFMQRRVIFPFWAFAFVVLVVFVGLRHHVGMDWNNYLGMIYRVSGGSLLEAREYAEPSYAFLLWVSSNLGMGIYLPNLVVALILMTGLFRYARSTPSPWIALLASIPFLVVVTGMSANRQAAAIGILLWAMAGWQRHPIWWRAFLIGLAATFHASAIVFLILVLADLNIQRGVKIAGVALFAMATVYYLTLTDKFDYYDQVYGSGQAEITQSSGAIFHVMINGAPAILYFLMPRYRSVLLPNDAHRHMAVAAVALIALAFFTSAAAGRASLYLFPVSMHIFAAMPLVIRGTGARFAYTVGCAAFFTGVLAFWLLASNTGFSYLPYENVFTVDPSLLQLCC
jgi:hypothetical protein